MPANKSSIASIGGNLKIFDIENGILCERAAYDGLNTSSIVGGRCSWAGDGCWLVGPVEEKDILPAFKYEQSKKLTRMRHITDAELSVATCFNQTNKKIVVGYKDGAVKIWNIKDKKVEQTLCTSGPNRIKFVEISADDAYVAATGAYAEKPVIKVFGRTTGKLLNNLTLDVPSDISDLKFSGIRKNFLGCSTMEGSVFVWDTYKAAKVMESKDVGVGACTGIALSPLNINLLASVTLSKYLTMHDIRQSAKVLQIELNSRLTAIDFTRFHPSLVLGSREGQLLLFDLRNSQIVHQAQAHNSAVTSLRVASDRTNVKTFEDAVVNTPDAPIIVTLPEEMSLSEVFTPPLLHQSIKQEINASSNDPQNNLVNVSPYNGTSLGKHSTPNVPFESQSQKYNDSFLNLIDAGAENSPGFSPFNNLPTISPFSVNSQPGRSPINFNRAQTMNRTILNGIREELEEQEILNQRNVAPNGVHNQSTRLTNGQQTELVKNGIQETKAASADCLPSESLRDMMRDIIREEMSSLRDEIREGMSSMRAEMRDEIQLTRAAVHRLRDEVETVAFAIKLDNVIMELDRKD